MKNVLISITTLVLTICLPTTALSLEASMSDSTTECLDCHASIHPGIVKGWQQSRHAQSTPKEAMMVKGLSRKVSAETVPENLLETTIGCAECHTLRPEDHADTFEHNGYDIHIVVSPNDCRTCHKEEAEQYSGNIMSHAYNNLAGNSIYQHLQRSIIGKKTESPKGKIISPAHEDTKAETCYYCHGTQLKVTGVVTRDTESAGEIEFPIIEGWPNQGVGRINLDGSRGTCSACHTRHAFSIETARKPHTCRECHVGPDVPAYKVYASSKHGNIYSTKHHKWDFKSVPWIIGEDFTAPTCATCHISLLVNTDGEEISKRTHQMSDRLPWRILGLIYAHPHPQNPDTTIIRNKDGLPLPTDFTGGRADEFLISRDEMEKRREAMQGACLTCHSTSWVDGQWKRFENTIQTTNSDILSATKTMGEIWQHQFAEGTDHGGNPFDEAIEKKWTNAWLFYANTIRFSSAMGCGGDYSVFADGRYELSNTLAELEEWLDLRKKLFSDTIPQKSNSKNPAGF